MYSSFLLPELVKGIVDYLSYENSLCKVLTINKTWYRISTEALYRHVNLYPKNISQFVTAIVGKKDAIKLCEYGELVRCISLFHFKDIRISKQISTIANVCTKISHIRIYYCPGITSETLTKMISKHQDKIHGITMETHEKISREVLEKIASCSHLEELILKTVGRGPFNNTDLFISIFRQCTSLRVLDVEHVLFATTNEIIQTIAEHLKYISVLRLVTYGESIIQENVLMSLAQSCVYITDFYLDGITGITDNVMRDLCHKKNCNYFVRRKCNCFGLLECKTKNKTNNLVHIFLRNVGLKHPITTQSLLHIAGNCPSLHTLEITGCHLSDLAIQSLVHSCKKIQRLCLGNEDFLFTDVVLLRIAVELSDIRELTVVNCQLTDESMVSLGQLCNKLEKLQFINRRGGGRMMQITDRTIFAFAKSLRSLSYLRLSDCEIRDKIFL
ncbi:F-box/LRR-repeat protein 20 isoform X2 [Rhizophagus irregularis DAOM 181602=DAOM 197198]|uniref:RNI-like protein n=1 Tax=Rhizophagus irregularis (strain DAOM 181602 / DAOM 197198 / MUCL 43194) TaxID=747089 RepID=U9UQ70_RHIID|nr:F-box/LRR-repeat protein 20 isoform X2 [Rhizophagus irregularis DAOM 181602=DAOM 197198]